MRSGLAARRNGVDAELRTEGSARAGIALTEDAKTGAVLAVAVPNHYEVARGVRRNRWKALNVGRVGVHAELGAQRVSLRPSAAWHERHHRKHEDRLSPHRAPFGGRPYAPQYGRSGLSLR